MADLNAASDPDRLITYGLGSCVGIVLYDAKRKIGGMAHFMLPSSLSASDRSNKAKFADTAVPLLLEKLEKLGARRAALVAKIAGGAHMFSANTSSDVIKVGARNAVAATDILRRLGIPLHANETGGTFGRTIELQTATGQLYIKTIGHGEKYV
jgi:chemotaxis protein CheD